MRVAGHVGSAPVKPQAPTLVYDDQCGFCRRWVERMKRRDHDDIVRLLSLEDEAARGVTGQPVERLRRAVHFVRSDGSVFAGAAAAREVLALLPGLGAIRVIAGVPGVMAVAEKIYAWVARRWGPVSD